MTTVTDLLALIRDDFALDVPATREAIASALATPAHTPQALEPMIGFLDRTMAASEMMGLAGFHMFLGQVRTVADQLTVAHDDEALQWISGWLEPATGYLEAPDMVDTHLPVIAYAAQCPVLDAAIDLETLASALEQGVSLPIDEDADAENALRDATPEDVSLNTEDVDLGLLAAMLNDASEQLDRLHHCVALANSPDQGETALAEAQRIAHTFKGSGNIVGIPGIARIAHRLEDLLEWTLARHHEQQTLSPLMQRDMNRAVDTLQSMIAALNGEEHAPPHAQAMLQRLVDWTAAIRADEVDAYAPDDVLSLDHGDAEKTDDASADSTGARAAEPVAAGSSQSLRVDVAQLNSILRKAGQSIINAQRFGQLMKETQERLDAALLRHKEIETRIQELQGAVDRQVVRLHGERDAGGHFDPLEMDRYDSMHSLSRFLAEAVQDEFQLTQDARSSVELASEVVREEQISLTDQHRALVRARMVPVRTILARLRRNVTQTAAATGKEAHLIVMGEDATVDADVLNRLTEPLLHLVRNAVDHGLEPADEREMLGKPAAGTITLSFAVKGQNVEVVCADDGRGLDYGTIFEKAVQYGIVERDQVLTADAMQRLILAPGFSTKGEVTEISGRGVGLDVVNDRVTGMKGHLDIASEPFAGTRFTITVPVSTGAVRVLMVLTGGEYVAIPTEQIVTVLAADQSVVTDGAITYDGKRYTAQSLAVWLGYEEPGVVRTTWQPAVITVGATEPVAVLVDQVLDVRELILQDAGRFLRSISGIVSTALRENGQPLFVMDIAALQRGASTSRNAATALAQRRRAVVKQTEIMVVDDALSVRRAMQQLLEDAGYAVTTCIDGQEAIERLRNTRPAVILTDLEMPNVNGIELTRRLRAQDTTHDIPVIMITSRATEKHRDLAIEAGVSQYLTKPYNDITLIAAVKGWSTSQVPRASAAA
jgi:chemotaxis protein histidine kinase CheA/ActR/RegA family two-component response regulator